MQMIWLVEFRLPDICDEMRMIRVVIFRLPHICNKMRMIWFAIAFSRFSVVSYKKVLFYEWQVDVALNSFDN